MIPAADALAIANCMTAYNRGRTKNSLFFEKHEPKTAALK
jgi:hypothetical protein